MHKGVLILANKLTASPKILGKIHSAKYIITENANDIVPWFYNAENKDMNCLLAVKA